MPEWSDIVKILGGLIAGFVGGFSLKTVLVSRSTLISTQQKGNTVGGNQAGRDVTISGEQRK
jgi:hypothetical protein